MNLRQHLVIAIFMTLVTTIVYGLAYPLGVTAIAESVFSETANGQLVLRDGRLVGSRLIAQPFTSQGYFWPRRSAAGEGQDASASGGSNLGPTNRHLVERVARDLRKWRATNPGVLVPIELVTASASGLDPHLSPAGALFQVPRIARERGIPQERLRDLVRSHVEDRQFGILGEPRVNVLELNLALDAMRTR